MLLQIILFTVAAIAAVLILAGQAGLLRGKPRGELGAKDGKLQRPSRTENSVCSQASLWPDHPMLRYASVAPLSYKGEAGVAMQKLAGVLAAMPRTVVVKQSADYLYAQASTALMRYTDDVEFLLDEAAHVIHVRSASRLGRKDLGANRKRVEAVRAAFASA